MKGDQVNRNRKQRDREVIQRHKKKKKELMERDKWEIINAGERKERQRGGREGMSV